MNEEELQKADSYALRFLSYRPRSEFEMRSRLRRKFTSEIVHRTVQNLKDRGFLDDIAFASAWTYSRMTYRPRCAYMVSRELFQKGVTIISALSFKENIFYKNLKSTGFFILPKKFFPHKSYFSINNFIESKNNIELNKWHISWGNHDNL